MTGRSEGETKTKLVSIRYHALMAILLCVALTASSFGAGTSTVVKVEPLQSDAEVGNTFTINITVLDVQNLYGLEVTLYWNPVILEVMNIDIRLGIESNYDGVLHEIPGTAEVQVYENETTQEQGKYILAASSVAPAPSFNGSGNVVRIIFNVTNPGTCELNLQTQLYDKPLAGEASEPISHTTQDGFFGKSSESFWWPFIIAVIVAIVAIVATILYFKKARVPKNASKPVGHSD